MNNRFELFIPKLRLFVSLGCSLEEQANLQPVDVSIKINFIDELPGCQSDQLSDVVCYKALVVSISQAVSGRSYHLIEFLAAQIFEVIVPQLKYNCSLEVSVAKPNHPVKDVYEPIVFKYAKLVISRPEISPLS